MLAPEMIEHLKHDLLFDHAHQFRRVALDARRIGVFGELMHALLYLFLADALFLRPVCDGGLKVHLAQACRQRVDIPRLGIGFTRDATGDQLVDDVGAHVANGLLNRFKRHHFAALLKHNLALVVGDVVVFQDVLANVEIARLDLLLRLLQRLVDPRMDDGLVFLQAKARQHRVHALGSEDAHQIVLQRQEEFGAARIALTAGATAQLVVDAPALVALGADDVESARLERHLLEAGDLGADFSFFCRALSLVRKPCAFLQHAHVDVAAELDVGAATRHIGGDGDGARHARFRHDERFLLMEAGVQNRELL